MTVDLARLRGDRATTFGYLGRTSATDADITDALAAERTAQSRRVVAIDPQPADLEQALMRRVARNLAMRGLPVAVLRGDAEGGDNTLLPGTDPEVKRLEAPHAKLRMG